MNDHEKQQRGFWVQVLTCLTQPPINIAIRVAVEHKFLELVAEMDGGSIDAEAIAKYRGVDESLVGVLTTLWCGNMGHLLIEHCPYNACPRCCRHLQ